MIPHPPTHRGTTDSLAPLLVAAQAVTENANSSARDAKLERLLHECNA